MTSYHIAELISLAMTFPTIVLAVAVVVVWSPAAMRAIQKKSDDRQGEDWFIVGVVAGALVLGAVALVSRLRGRKA